MSGSVSSTSDNRTIPKTAEIYHRRADSKEKKENDGEGACAEEIDLGDNFEQNSHTRSYTVKLRDHLWESMKRFNSQLVSVYR